MLNRNSKLAGKARKVWLVLVALVLIASTSPVSADFDQSRAWFDKLTIDQRSDLQGNLILLAHYGGIVDGAFGNNTYSAITAWQRSIGALATGVLTDDDQQLVGQMASEVMSDLGIGLVEDTIGHLAIMLPMSLLVEKQQVPNGTLYQDPTGEFSAEVFWRSSSEGTLSQFYHEASTPTVGRSVTYSALGNTFYVVTGSDNGRFYYELVHADGEATAGFRFVYSEKFRMVGGVSSVFAASYSSPISITELADNPPATPVPAVVPSKTQKSKILMPSDWNAEGADGVRQFGSFIVIDDAPGVIGLVGDIGPSTPLDFRRALRAVGEAKVLALASDGGSVSSALIVAYEVHELGISTWVLPETGCYSACAFLFLAGSERLVEGELGVHQVWGEQVDASTAQTVVSDILEAFDDFDVPQEVTSAMLRTLPEDMYVFDPAELQAWGLNRGSVF